MKIKQKTEVNNYQIINIKKKHWCGIFRQSNEMLERITMRFKVASAFGERRASDVETIMENQTTEVTQR